MFVYAVTNHKGGVGKTTAAATLGAAFVLLGRRVLLVDLDPKASLTAAVSARFDGETAEDLFDTPSRAERTIVPCASGMEIIPARASLAIKLRALSYVPDAKARLKIALESLKSRFDTVLIDCNSNLDGGLANALTAAHIALVPFQCDYLSLRGLIDTQAICSAIMQDSNPGLVVRAFANMHDRRTTYASDSLAEARAALGAQLLDVIVPRSVRLAEAPAMGTSVLASSPRCLGAEAYRRLANELIEGETHYGTTGRHPIGNTHASQRWADGGNALTISAAAGA